MAWRKALEGGRRGWRIAPSDRRGPGMRRKRARQRSGPPQPMFLTAPPLIDLDRVALTLDHQLRRSHEVFRSRNPKQRHGDGLY